ncbi:MAG: calcium/sodium antiporter [Saprospiraceae bacterium]|nr:calcium/sodium antiporter [Saprospiraceae bacterium]
MITYILFVVGLAALIKGADWLVTGSSAIAKQMGLSDFVIGLTIVSVGTSAPELIVNVMASIEGSAGIAIGNVLGSNIANVLLILGVAAIIYSLPIRRNTVLSEIPFSLAAALLVGFLANTDLFGNENEIAGLSRGDGIIILFFFGLFLLYVFTLPSAQEEAAEQPIAVLPIKRAWLLTGAGIVGLFFGGKWVVEGAIEMSKSLGMSEEFVGLTIVAIGTSLPELVTSAVAAFRKNTDIAVGNVVGSNIFNLLLVLGLSSVIRPLKFHASSNIDILVVVFSGALVIVALAVGRKLVIKRPAGILFTASYVAYIVYLVMRG